MFRFTIRELVLVTAVAALACGWWIDRARLGNRAERATVLEAVVDSAGWKVTYDKRGNHVSQINISRK